MEIFQSSLSENMCQNGSREPDFMERFREPKLCAIPETSAEPKPDAFEQFRPRPCTVLNYHISQTDIKSQKKHNIGVIKLHMKQTEARYELPPPGYVFPESLRPPPPRPPVTVYSSARPPVCEFLDDIRRRKIEREQIQHKENFKRLQANVRKFDATLKNAMHQRLMALVGPDWFQELSPKQTQTIENLKTCILMDVKSKTTCNTEMNMAELGLVLRPNPKHIKAALKKCCECPVEFLLILYQLMNHRRTKYSLNDRLLLSGVAHLTMRETLKELHIRIPSPPRPLEKPLISPKKPKPRQYKSPYLVPFTFVPEPPKHTGVYKKNFIQYPESPYFSYINEMKSEVAGNIDTQVMQGEDGEEVEVKILITEKQSGITDEQEKELVKEMKLAQMTYNKMGDHESVPLLRKPTIYIPCDHGVTPPKEESQELVFSDPETNATVQVEVKVTTDFDEYNQPIRKVCECNFKLDESTVAKDRFKDGGLPTLLNGEAGEEMDDAVDKKRLQGGGLSKELEDEIDEIGEKGAQPEENSRNEMADKENINKRERVISVGKRDSMECGCKEEVERLMENRLCQCERCQADRAASEAAAAAVDNDTTRVCDCLQKYQSKTAMYEKMKKRFDVQHDLKTLQKQYVIGGVTQSPTGDPVYILSGVKPETTCVCALAREAQLKEEKRLANMPKLPIGAKKYMIMGVQETNEGNVFVLSGAKGVKCDCVNVYKSFEQKHHFCMEAYEKYLKKIEIDKQEYMQELKADGRFEDTVSSAPEDEATSEPKEQADQTSELDNANQPDKTSAGAPDSVNVETSRRSVSGGKSFVSNLETIDEQEACNCSFPKFPNVTIDTDLTLTLEVNKDKNRKGVCTCDPNYTFFVCQKIQSDTCVCGPSSESTTTTIATVSDQMTEFKRYIILDKIPCKLSDQREILTKALAVLAEDGFPLAKLPDCFKLPHFKLWMQLRCGKFWTQEDRFPMLMESYGHWRHQGYCYRKTRLPTLKMSKEQARKYTWIHAKTVRRMALEKETWFYRKMRQTNIEVGREFFPSTFAHELPTPNFRDCFFAYTASKEEECLCWKPWYSHEYNNVT